MNKCDTNGRSAQILAVIGCGLRADSYLVEMRHALDDDLHLVALADPNENARAVYLRNFCSDKIRTFSSGPELLSAMGKELDAVIIASPNALHAEALLPALENRLTILLEKPVATTVEDCDSIWQAYLRANSPPLAVGFVLRYTAFYKKVKELLDAGQIGTVLSVQADEMMDPVLTSMYMRGWRRRAELSGPLLLEKCSHDLDVLNSLVGARVKRLSSFGLRTRFVENPEAEMHCRECKLKNACRYAVDKIAPYLTNHERGEALKDIIPLENDICVYNSDKEIWDHQVVNLSYENDVLATFTVCTDQPRTTRTIKICGTQGQIWGDISQDRLELRCHGGSQIERIEISHDGSAHHGGDSVISKQFLAMLRNEPVRPLAGLKEGIEAVLIALAAERSIEQSRVITGDEIYSCVRNFS